MRDQGHTVSRDAELWHVHARQVRVPVGAAAYPGHPHFTGCLCLLPHLQAQVYPTLVGPTKLLAAAIPGFHVLMQFPNLARWSVL